jgi:DNA topoisomerase-1
MLLILESHSKCATIESFPGIKVKCVATGGHIRETIGGIEGIKSNYMPSWINSKGKKLSQLKAAVANAQVIYLGMDGDREGEAIAWHLCEVLKLPRTTKRVVFHSVTPNAVRTALESPRPIDMALVNAQIARVVCDMLVGFTISPVLWRQFGSRKNISAGRCQTPALGLVIGAIQDNSPLLCSHRVATIFVELPIRFILDTTFPEETDVKTFLKHSIGYDHILSIGEYKDHVVNAPTPLTTSSLQQIASSRLDWSPKKTMKEAGVLYNAGLITYPRTDKPQYSEDFRKVAKAFVESKWGQSYTRDHIGTASAKHAQDAHEAIRCTSLETTNSSPLYKLIALLTIQSCMADCRVKRRSITTTAPGDRLYWAVQETTVFDGWRRADGTISTSFQEAELAVAMDRLASGEVLEISIASGQVATTGGSRYLKEASLVKRLESVGIGRPSTYAGLVEKIIDRHYVDKKDVDGMEIDTTLHTLNPPVITSASFKSTVGVQRNVLVPSALGIEVYSFCMAHYEQLFAQEYTSLLESQLDDVASGTRTREQICQDLHTEINEATSVPIMAPKRYSYCAGKHGPCLKETDSQGKCSFAPLQKGVTKALVDSMSDPTTLIHQDIEIAKVDGIPVFLKKGPYGLYLKCGPNICSWKGALNPSAEEAVATLSSKTKTGVLRKLHNWDIRKGVKSFPDYAQKRTRGRGRSKKPVRVPMEGYVGDYLEDMADTVEEWIAGKKNDREKRDYSDDKVM